MKIEQNIISRDWHVQHKGKTYYVNYTNSDGQTLALLNRDYWDIEVEDDDGEVGPLNIYSFSKSSLRQKREARRNARLFDKLVEFCLQHWDIPKEMHPAQGEENDAASR